MFWVCLYLSHRVPYFYFGSDSKISSAHQVLMRVKKLQFSSCKFTLVLKEKYILKFGKTQKGFSLHWAKMTKKKTLSFNSFSTQVLVNNFFIQLYDDWKSYKIWILKLGYLPFLLGILGRSQSLEMSLKSGPSCSGIYNGDNCWEQISL